MSVSIERFWSVLKAVVTHEFSCVAYYDKFHFCYVYELPPITKLIFVRKKNISSTADNQILLKQIYSIFLAEFSFAAVLRQTVHCFFVCVMGKSLFEGAQASGLNDMMWVNFWKSTWPLFCFVRSLVHKRPKLVCFEWIRFPLRTKKNTLRTLFCYLLPVPHNGFLFVGQILHKYAGFILEVSFLLCTLFKKQKISHGIQSIHTTE